MKIKGSSLVLFPREDCIYQIDSLVWVGSCDIHSDSEAVHGPSLNFSDPQVDTSG